MTGLSHAATGVAIAVAVPHAVFALPLAFVSHFVLDKLPHWGSNHLDGRHKIFRRIILLDTIAGVGFVLFMMLAMPQHALLIALAAMAATAPDLMWLPNFIREVKGLASKPHNAIMRWHNKLQFERRWGIATEGFWLLTVLVTLWKL
ncbi:hypothetical protein IRY61_04940 [Candidatus Saccharibacteria bacterium]|nr:hypothetical protein [Candidatus Saccharibacteria bacterium]